MSAWRAVIPGVGAKVATLGVAPAAKAALDMRVEKAPRRLRPAQRIEKRDRNVIIDIFAGLPERHTEQLGVIIEADAVDHRGVLYPAGAHIFPAPNGLTRSSPNGEPNPASADMSPRRGGGHLRQVSRHYPGRL